MEMIATVRTWYERTWAPFADPRTTDWLLLGDPWQPLMVAGLYLAMVFIGPRLMASRSAWDVSSVLVVYNLAQSIFSGYMFYEVLMSSLDGMSWMCSVIDTSTVGSPLRLARVCWLYYISKVIDYLDTVFFILRKKNNQVSFLHVYHHVSMFLWWWFVTKFYPGGSVFFGPLCNTFVHIVMYYYYMQTATGKRVWWKKYLTTFQMVQFLIVISNNMLVLYLDCGFPRWIVVSNTVYMFSLFFLFRSFSVKAYGNAASQLPQKKMA